MKNNEALIMLSDAIDLQKETLQILREALAVLKVAVEELKASRMPTYATITCDGTKTISNVYTSEAKGVNVFYSNIKDVCGKSL